MPAISVVIPLYNKGMHIERAINSVRNQTFQDFEIIVVEGGSTDNGKQIVSSISDDRIRLILQSSRGVSRARNEGVHASISELIAFLDADDEWMPCHLEELMKLKSNFPSAAIFATEYFIITEKGNKKCPNIKYVPKAPWSGLLDHYFLVVSSGEAPFLISTMAIHKKNFIKMGGFLPEWNWAEDHELWGRIALYYPIAYSRKCGAYWHLDAQNRLGHRPPPLEMEPVYATVKNFLLENLIQGEKLSEINEFLALKEIEFSIRLYQAGERSRAILLMRNCETKLFKFYKIKWRIIFIIPTRGYFLFKLWQNKIFRLFHIC
jgi:glycosyltransferase involved in cell wall biosynthesis